MTVNKIEEPLFNLINLMYFSTVAVDPSGIAILVTISGYVNQPVYVALDGVGALWRQKLGTYS